MFRMWIRQIKDNRLLKDITVEDDSQETRTHKVFNAIDQACREFNIPRPIWLELNIKDFKRYSRTRFTGDSFVEELDFDYIEIRMLEED